MEGSWWNCLLEQVAAGFNLANSAVGLVTQQPPVPEPPPPAPPSPDWPALLAADQALVAKMMPDAYHLS